MSSNERRFGAFERFARRWIELAELHGSRQGGPQFASALRSPATCRPAGPPHDSALGRAAITPSTGSHNIGTGGKCELRSGTGPPDVASAGTDPRRVLLRARGVRRSRRARLRGGHPLAQLLRLAGRAVRRSRPWPGHRHLLCPERCPATFRRQRKYGRPTMLGRQGTRHDSGESPCARPRQQMAPYPSQTHPVAAVAYRNPQQSRPPADH